MKPYQQMIAEKLVSVKKIIIPKPRCNGKTMSHHYFLNKDHTYRPCSTMEWARQFEAIDRHIADDTINNYRISTVWLGLNHAFNNGPPLLFETMVFKPKGGDAYCARFTTWEEAEAGHQKAIQWVKDGCKEDEL